MLVDFKTEHNYDHFDNTKTSKTYQAMLQESLALLQAVPGAQVSQSTTSHSTGSEGSDSHYPASWFYVLIDISLQIHISRYYTLLLAIATLNHESLIGFSYELMPYDPQARYRLDLRW